MRNVTLDLAPFEEKISLHRYLKEALDFPLLLWRKPGRPS